MKKLLTILVLIMLIISFFQITNMYALYKERIEGEYNTLLGAWKIKVNSTDITSSGQVEKFTINQVGYISSEYIQSGKIAPSGLAYFDVVIDPEDTDVSIIYEINMPEIPNVTIDLISVDNYLKKDGETDIENTDVAINGNQYRAIIPVDKIAIGYENYIRLTFRWTNEEEYNETDSQLAQNENSQISIPLEINLKQYIGEGVEFETE